MTTRKVTILLSSLAAALVLACVGLLGLIGGEPFRVMVQPAGDRATIQFERPDDGLVSPVFPIDRVGLSRQVGGLRVADRLIPACVVEFIDTTILPGRIRIRIDAQSYDVMERAVIVGGKEYAWQMR